MNERESMETGTLSATGTRFPARVLRSRSSRAVMIAILIAAAVLIVTVLRRGSASDSPRLLSVQEQVQTAVDSALKKAAGAPARSAVVYQSIAPSLVLVSTSDAATGTNLTGASSGLGTGVVVNAQGSILTANHVVEKATTIRLTFADGTDAVGRIVSQDPETDIAVLEADRAPEVIVPAVLGGGVRVGDEVFAVGHPLGLVGSMSSGVVSGLDRSIPVDGGQILDGLIQFDAAVNPGSSGGPLLNRNGQVVGIVTALANPSKQGFFVGIGFAVPIGDAAGGAGGPPQ